MAAPPFYLDFRTRRRSSYSRRPEAGRDLTARADRAADAALDFETVTGLARGPGPGRVLSGDDPAGAQAVRHVLEKSPETVE